MASTPATSSSTKTPWDPAQRTSHPIHARPKPKHHPLQLVAFLALFGSSCICIHATQLLLWPLKYFWAGSYESGINFTKKQFGLLCLFCVQTFAPTTIRLTLEEGIQRKDVICPRKAADPTTGQSGLCGLKLPRRHVIMANHQVYLDWMLAWIMLYFSDMHGAIVIILKNTLKWVPVLGPAMQFYDFIFFARSWAADKLVLNDSLTSMGARATSAREPLSLLIFPEGTLVSRDTRPISTKFSEKQQIADMHHSLLPRSTGLLACLRALAPKISDLQLVDLTIGYEGVPQDGYGQDYYTLASFFGAGDAPPRVHVHYRTLSIDQIPIGRLDSGPDPTEKEREMFAEWLLQQWRAKDALLKHFYTTGSFDGGKNVTPGSATDLPLQMMEQSDTIALFGGMLPGLAFVYESVKRLCALVL